jgi:hypothetical protein
LIGERLRGNRLKFSTPRLKHGKVSRLIQPAKLSVFAGALAAQPLSGSGGNGAPKGLI